MKTENQNPESGTPNPKPAHLKSEARNPKRETRIPKLETRNPKTETRTPDPQISGHDGGTGASPLSSIKHAGVPWFEPCTLNPAP